MNSTQLQKTEWVDSHCHLQYEFEGRSPSQLVASARARGVGQIITIGTKPSDYATIQGIAHSLPGVYYTLGTHPHETADQNLALDEIRAASGDPRFVAVGELGLDYFYNFSEPNLQMAALDQQLSLANELHKPVVIHSRDAEGDLLPLLARYAQNQSLEDVGVIHCFTGTRDFAESCLNLGFLIGISGIVTFKNAQDLRDIVKWLPLDRIVVETDAPFLAPVPHRGKKAEPAMVVDTGHFIANLRGIPIHEFASITSANSRRLFHLPSEDFLLESC